MRPSVAVVPVLVAIAAWVLIGSPWGLDSAPAPDPFAMNQQGLAHYFGKEGRRDFSKARECFQVAAEQGYAPAQVNLGMMYDHGDGVPRNYQTAMRWYQQAADQGDRDGRQMLGTMYFYGLGVTPDPHKAMYYFVAATGEIPAGERLFAASQPKD